jgi:Cu-Zn family superoxide dismutase
MKKIGAAALVLLVALAYLSDKRLGAADEDKGVVRAVAVLHPLGKSKVRGRVVFTERDGMVEVRGTVRGLEPGKHGFHIHEFGDCSAADGSSAGGHFNPTKMMHGRPEDENRHVGDLGNIEADDSGVAKFNMKDSVIKLSGPNSILGRAVIVHAKPDDFSQPVGNAGGRVACGAIGIANPKPPAKKK